MTKKDLLSYIDALTPIIRIVSLITLVVWFVADIHNDIELQNLKIDSLQHAYVDLSTRVDMDNKNQDDSQLRMQNQMDARLLRIEENIQKIYNILCTKGDRR